MQTGSKLQAERLHRRYQGLCTADRAGGAVKCGEEAIAGGAHLNAAVTAKYRADDLVVTFEQLLPRSVAHRRGSLVGEVQSTAGVDVRANQGSPRTHGLSL